MTQKSAVPLYFVAKACSHADVVGVCEFGKDISDSINFGGISLAS